MVLAPANRTFPSRILDHVRTPEAQKGFLERIDFILTDPATAATCRSVDYPADAELDTISDHDPVIARFGPRRGNGRPVERSTDRAERHAGAAIFIRRSRNSRGNRAAIALSGG
ncbi:MAG: hypothetical protein H7A49_12600 [Akkermansiaceae bacterium]|nr:hypothetical protein [Akkermansiaceae bacterium]MCP5544735.1 hypothetical protein [Akkermansiaceae bacterium]MCP5545875.1 hypothetical protein [Akkermansiaceae bacterium]